MLSLDDSIEQFLRKLTAFSAPEQNDIEKAVSMMKEAHKEQKRSDGTPYALHPLAATEILLEWGADKETIIAGLLHDTLEDTELTPKQIRDAFGRSSVLALIDGVTKFTQADFEGQESLDRKVETLRKLFEVMRSDIRVAVIKLADRLHNVRTIDALSEDRQKRFAKETLDIYYKIAFHLGMNEMRRELSELCYPILYPEESAEFQKRRKQEMGAAKSVLPLIERELFAEDRDGSLVSLRMAPRSFSSLAEHKTRRREEEPAFCLVATAASRDGCYELLKVVHTLYRPIPGTFRDFIATPTESAYQSLRTTVLGPRDVLLPIRIRTDKMDAQEQRGVLLKCFQTARDIPGFSWLQRSENLDRTTRDSSESFWNALQSDIFQETFSVNVDGETISIARGATMLDAAYARYGKNANRLIKLMANGATTSLSTLVADGDVLSVRLDSYPHVSLDWLKFVSTRYARTIIVESLKERDINEKLTIGQQMIQKELDYFKKGLIGELTRAQKESVSDAFRRTSFKEVVAMVGEGVLLPSDVVFALYPEKKPSKLLKGKKRAKYPFRIRITGGQGPNENILPQVSALARVHDTEIKQAGMRSNSKRGAFLMTVRGIAPNRLHFADFLAALERQADISNIQTLLSRKQLCSLFGWIMLAFGVIILDVLLLPSYEQLPHMPQLLLQVLPLLPIIGVNYMLLKLLRHYLARIRTERAFIGLGFLMNFIGITVVIVRSNAIGGTLPLLPVVSVFVLSMFYLGYNFFQSEAMFTQSERRGTRPLSTEEWKKIRKKKRTGYLIRLAAVCLWGFQPLYLKYTPAGEIDPFIRLYLMYIGALAVTMLFIVLCKPMQRGGGKRSLRIPLTGYLLGIVAGEAFFLYFQSTSLLTTTSTNFALLSNFSPVLALLVAAILWRHSIPYLRDTKHMFWIFLIFLMGSTGGSVIIYHSAKFAHAETIRGDLFALAAMVADVVVITSQIRYIKIISKASSLAINVNMFGWTTLVLTPPILYLAANASSALNSLTQVQLLFGLGAGVILAVGMVCNLEAFRRIDGFIAFLMFNISILINFTAEVFFLGTFVPTWTLILGGIIIISSTILAELVNSRCEKQGL